MLSQIEWQYDLVYLDNIVNSSCSPCGHIGHVKRVLSILQDAGATLKLKNYNFVTSTIDYLGHVIQPCWVEIATLAIDAIKRFKAPTNITEFCSFLQFYNAFRRFVPNSVPIGAPLIKKLENNQPTLFGALWVHQLNAKHELQNKLVSLPIPAFPYAWGSYTLDTNAWKV